jgi:hypothetical protein
MVTSLLLYHPAGVYHIVSSAMISAHFGKHLIALLIQSNLHGCPSLCAGLPGAAALP